MTPYPQECHWCQQRPPTWLRMATVNSESGEEVAVWFQCTACGNRTESGGPDATPPYADHPDEPGPDSERNGYARPEPDESER